VAGTSRAEGAAAAAADRAASSRTAPARRADIAIGGRKNRRGSAMLSRKKGSPHSVGMEEVESSDQRVAASDRKSARCSSGPLGVGEDWGGDGPGWAGWRRQTRLRGAPAKPRADQEAFPARRTGDGRTSAHCGLDGSYCAPANRSPC